MSHSNWKRLKLSAAVVLLAGAAACAKGAGVETQQRAREAVGAGAVLLDVRTPEEFAEGHIEGAVNIPVQDLAQRAKELPGKADTYVVYCRSGKRSASAAEWLTANGYVKVIDLGAMSNWR